MCIRFRKAAILAAVKDNILARCRTVQYVSLREMRKTAPKVQDLPFLKRRAYEPENEFRIIYDNPLDDVASLGLDIGLSSIDRITLSPWAHQSLTPHVTAALKLLDGCSKLKIYRSTLISNDDWRKHGASAIGIKSARR